MKQTSIFIGVALVFVVGLSFLLFASTTKTPVVPQAEEIPVTEEVAKTAKITYNNTSADVIAVELPYPGAVTGKEFGVIGKARGYWFFEASFPIEVLDKDGAVLATGIATAIGEWMTEDFVQFVSEIKIPESYTGPATIVLKKDNPSGEPQNDASISFPIVVEY